MGTAEFVDLVDDKNLLRRLDFLRRLGNTAAHSGKKISRDQARLALENLFYFLDFVACCYAPDYQPHDFDPALLPELEDAVIVDRKALAAAAVEPVMFYTATAAQISQPPPGPGDGRRPPEGRSPRSPCRRRWASPPRDTRLPSPGPLSSPRPGAWRRYTASGSRTR